METEYHFKLVKGEFAPSEAGKVLFSLIQNKINYHNLEIFSKQIREGFDQDRDHSEKRVADLKEINRSLADFLKKAGEEGKDVEIKGSFEIKLVE